MINKIHDNKIFDNLSISKDVLISGNKNKHGDFDSDFLKTRPAVVLSNFKYNSKGESVLLVVPLTTKTTYKKLQNSFRSPFNALKKPSFLMWDSVMKVKTNQVQFIYSIGGKMIDLSNSAKKYIFKEGNQKLLNWINL
ncbi:hypothetical protein SCHIN_v1c07540 [Spiroplasma chinense]|uniref:Uncharacterized protein n=1 Tax=Spiroplasma chinense TaxID=216932 RepID=A0A5B9Y5H6_9MOLU|nr:type II toxin-antitoxin system PemK/MazF family toxin [Spiroplasma chinense]QEH61949.1 hypothetical protein SCHIN_v1c07540 [Spiroplasma chinense]